MIPEQFLNRMRSMPHLDFDAFCAALDTPAVRALRVNTIKTDTDTLLFVLPFDVTPVPFGQNAFYAPEDKVGALPAHHAGMMYMQDPGAISAVAAATPTPGMRVIDLCAAPGGKSTQLAAAISPDGVLVCNEYVPSRCRILQGNVERLGAKHAIVTNLDTAALADFYGAYFDLVVADVPCSGEGMFRKYEVASEEWSEENVLLCAARGFDILENAAKLVAPGGKLLFSTCTFAPEENECNVDRFLGAHPDFALVPVAPEIAKNTADGVTFDGLSHDMSLCRRFYPHLSPGEGQFVALLQRNDEGALATPRDAITAPDKKTATLAYQFLDEVLTTRPDARLVQLRDDLYLAPHIPIPSKGVFAPGVCIGTLTKGRIVPHHQLFSAYGKDFRRMLSLAHGDARVMKYLRGEEIEAPELASKNGFAVLLYEGAPLGGGKIVGGMLKNHYPKGLRNRTSLT